MSKEETLKEIHQAVLSTFKSAKRGYCWLDAKFGSLRWDWFDEKKVNEILECILSKKGKYTCPIHKRRHEGN